MSQGPTTNSYGDAIKDSDRVLLSKKIEDLLESVSGEMKSGDESFIEDIGQALFDNEPITRRELLKVYYIYNRYINNEDNKQ